VATKLHAKLAEVMKEVGYVQKDSRNDFHKYRYASAEAVLKKVNAALSERGIAVSSAAHLEHFEPGSAVVRLSLTFHDGDESLTVEGLGEGSDKGDKATMKANTAALKYAMANAFLISWGDDPEADVETDMDAAHVRSAASGPEENPTADSDLESYPEAQPIVASMKGKRGVRELKQFLAHCSIEGMDWAAVLAFAKEQDVDLLNGLPLAACTKLRDMVKQQRGVGVRT